MPFYKTPLMIVAMSLALSGPVFAQNTTNPDTGTPTGRSDSSSSGQMKSDTPKSGGMKKKEMTSPTPNGTSTPAGPAGKTADPTRN